MITNIQTYILTFPGSAKIIPLQLYMINKYWGNLDVHYIWKQDLEPETWTKAVLNGIKDAPEYIIFGLDDFIPIAPIHKKNLIHAVTTMYQLDMDRIGLSYSEYHNKFVTPDDFQHYENDLYIFIPDGPYSCNAQFSLWNTQILRACLEKTTTAWSFETEQTLRRTGCFKDNVPLRYAEEGAISRKWPNHVNLMGMKHSDIEEVKALKLVDKVGFLEREEFDINFVPDKYKEFYV